MSVTANLSAFLLSTLINDSSLVALLGDADHIQLAKTGEKPPAGNHLTYLINADVDMTPHNSATRQVQVVFTAHVSSQILAVRVLDAVRDIVEGLSLPVFATGVSVFDWQYESRSGGTWDGDNGRWSVSGIHSLRCKRR